jgi:hypothetical protein
VRVGKGRITVEIRDAGAAVAVTMTEAEADALAGLLATAEPSAGAWDELAFERLSSAGRIDAAVACERLVRHAQGLLVRALGALAREVETERGVERGCTEAEVGAALRWSPYAVQQRLGTAGALTGRFPETLRLLEAGQVGFGQAVAMVEATAGIEDVAVARGVQERVLSLLPGQTPAATRKALRRAVLAADPDGAQSRHEYEAERRRVELCPEEDGMATLALYTTAAMGTAMMAALTQRAQTERTQCRVSGDERSMDQRRADALVALVLTAPGVRLATSAGARARARARATESATATRPSDAVVRLARTQDADTATRPDGTDVRFARTQGVGIATRPGDAVVRLARTQDADTATRPDGELVRFARTSDASRMDGLLPAALVHVVVGLDTLLGTDDAPAELRGYGPITATEARALAYGQHTTWRRLLTAPDGTLIHADARTYRPAAPLDRHVRLRDQTCTFPGCAMPAARCDLDHAEPFDHQNPAAGGSTSRDNLHALCRRHHRLKTAGLWNVTRDSATDTTTWTAPTGRIYTTRPRPYLTAA